MQIRPETAADQDAVRELHRHAFSHQPDKVTGLVDTLRSAMSIARDLSLVAVQDDQVIGHLMLTHSLLDAPDQLVDVQVLSPLGVLPGFQRRGVGGQLVGTGLRLAAEREAPMVFLEGSPDYYSRLGFKAAIELGFRKPSLRIPDPAFQVYPLPGYQPWMTGTLVYSQAFWQHDAVGLRERAE